MCLWMSDTQQPMMDWWEPGACIDTPLSSSGLHNQACILLQKLVLYSRNKASRRQMSSTLPSLPSTDGKIRQYAFQNYTEITWPRVCLPACLSILPPVRPAWHPGHLLPGCGVWAGAAWRCLG